MLLELGVTARKYAKHELDLARKRGETEREYDLRRSHSTLGKAPVMGGPVVGVSEFGNVCPKLAVGVFLEGVALDTSGFMADYRVPPEFMDVYESLPHGLVVDETVARVFADHSTPWARRSRSLCVSLPLTGGRNRTRQCYRFPVGQR